MRITAYAASDVGRHREGNEDNMYSGNTVFAVADGMGGHQAGEVASEMALRPVAELDGRTFDEPKGATEALRAAIEAANRSVVSEARNDPSLAGMGTTLTAVMVRSDRLHLAHVGDSRAYLLRPGEEITLLTTDHTLVEQLVQDGRLSRDEVASHPQRSVITRAVGVESDIEVDTLVPLVLQPGDQILLCSDGLTGPVTEETIADLLATEPDGDAVVQQLIQAANDAGGPDNITVVLLRVEDDGTGVAAAPDESADDDLDDESTAAIGEVPRSIPIRTRPESENHDWARDMSRYGDRQGVDSGTGLDNRSGRGRRILGILTGVIVILGILLAGGYLVLSRAFFIAPASNGNVAIFTGMNDSVAGVPLYRQVEDTGLPMASLPQFQQDRINEGITAASREQAEETVAGYRAELEDAATEGSGTRRRRDKPSTKTTPEPATAAPVAASPEIRRRSNTELGLLVLAVIVILCAYALVGLAQTETIPPGLLAYAGAMTALAIAGHLVSRRLARGADPLLLPLAFLLNGLGLVMVRRLDFAQEASRAPAQTVWAVVAVAAFVATLVIVRDHNMLDQYRYLIGIAALAFLLMPLLPIIGKEVNGARIWLGLGGMSFQPGEIAKLGLVAFFASYLAEKRGLLTVATNRLGPFHVPPARAFGPILVVWGVSLSVLVFQKDLGLSLLVFGIFVLMLYIATGRPAYAFAGVAMFGAGAFAAWTLFSHVASRVGTWLDPWAVYEGAGFQVAQSLFAMGTGGLFGVGLGQGRPDLIPEVGTDFIFAAFGEEMGLIGTTALLLCYFLLIGRGLHIASRARDDFGQLLAAGLTVLFGLQVFVILGGVTRLLPLTGLTLPFISYGGSSLVANYALIALLMRVSAAGEREGV